MGLCASNEPEHIKAMRRRDKELANAHRKRKQQTSKVSKVLLLGAGESGKSTVLKQMKILYGEGLDKAQGKATIQSNIVVAIHELIVQSDRLVREGLVDEKEELAVIAENQDAKDKFLERFEASGARMDIDQEVGAWIKAIWNDPGIQNTYSHKSLFQIQDNVEYFCGELDRLLETDFEPTDDDGLRIRIRTTGLIRERFNIDDQIIEMLDVGGQKNERSKWIDQFEGVHAVIFMAAISEYDQVMFEDEQTNRMRDSLDLFRGLVREPWFQDSTFLIFLNKRDLFEKKFPNSPLSKTFPDYPKDMENNIDFAMEFIQAKYLAQLGQSRDIVTQITTATNSENMRQVLGAVQHTIVSNNLREMGIALQ